MPKCLEAWWLLGLLAYWLAALDWIGSERLLDKRKWWDWRITRCSHMLDAQSLDNWIMILGGDTCGSFGGIMWIIIHMACADTHIWKFQIPQNESLGFRLVQSICQLLLGCCSCVFGSPCYYQTDCMDREIILRVRRTILVSLEQLYQQTTCVRVGAHLLILSQFMRCIINERYVNRLSWNVLVVNPGSRYPISGWLHVWRIGWLVESSPSMCGRPMCDTGPTSRRCAITINSVCVDQVWQSGAFVLIVTSFVRVAQQQLPPHRGK